MLGWALIINYLGRRRYPVYWLAAGKTFVSATPAVHEKERRDELREMEAGLRSTEGGLFNRANDEEKGFEGNNKVSANRDRAGGHLNGTGSA